MLNQIVLVGRLTEISILEEEGKKKEIITLGVARNFENKEGIYETDLIKCYLSKYFYNNTLEYLKKGDAIGVRGRLETTENNELVVIVEKLFFLSSRVKQDN